jgi:hypothetical protein
VVEIHEEGRVRVMRKEPFVDAEVVADFSDMNKRHCRWRPGAQAPDLDEVISEVGA